MNKSINLNQNLIFKSVVLFPGIGTGFFYKLSKDGKTYYTIITNNHVFELFKENTIIKFYLEINKGEFDPAESKIKEIKEREICLPIKVNDDKNNQFDLCMIILKNEFVMSNEVIKQNFIINNDKITDNTSMFQENIFPDLRMIGFPFADKHIPFMRSGTLSSPITVNNKLDGIFYGDIESIGGSSGSPVFAIIDNNFMLDKSKTVMFIGINRGYRHIEHDVYEEGKEKEEYKLENGNHLRIKENSRLCVIISSNQLKLFEKYIDDIKT